MKKNRKLNKSLLISLVYIGVLVALFSLDYSGFFKPIENSLLDQKFRIFQREAPNDHIAMVMIDQKSLDLFIQKHNIYWPWPREVYSIVHNYLMAKQARVVVYDILFDQPDFDRNGMKGEISDQSLEQLFGTYGNAVLSAQAIESDSGYTSTKLSPFSYPIQTKDPYPLYTVHNIPIPRFLKTAQKIGSVAIPTQNETVIRSVPLFFNLKDHQALPSLSMAAYLAYKNEPIKQILEANHTLSFDSLRIPLQPNGRYLVNWYKEAASQAGSFEHISFYALFEAGLAYRQTGQAKNDRFINLKNKIVFVGANAAGLSDIKSTPMSPLKPFPGVEIHATVTNNLLEHDFIQTVPNTVKRVLIVLLAAILLIGIFWGSSKLNIPLTIFILSLVIIAGLTLFGLYRIWLPTAELFLSSLLVVIVGYTVKYVTEDAQKRAIRSAFDLYLQKELVEQIIDQPELLKLGGDKKELTVLFSDLAGFTTISEKIEPEELIKFLNEYLSEMTDIVFKNKGTLDKYIGDAIMAFWGAPVPAKDHAYLACKCVLEMEDKLQELHEKWTAEGMPAPHVRYGLNSGPMVVGNMGSKDRFSYTVLGDNVNLGARLEPANKDFGTRILISEATRNHVHDRMLTREVALMKAKGKTKPIRIFELICDRESPSNEKWVPFVLLFDEALNHYYKRRWDEAEAKFRQALDHKAEDQLCQIYLQHIEEFKTNPPGANWEGSYQQTNK